MSIAEQLADEIYGLHCDIGRLEVENRKLRAACDAWAENDAKLRKLVRDIYSEYRYLRVRFHRTYVQHEERMRSIERRMRKLGIEVS